MLLEDILDLPGPYALGDLRPRAKGRFYSIINYYRASEVPSELSQPLYSRAVLVRSTYQHSCSESSQDTFLRAFSDFLKFDIASEDDPDFDADGNQLKEDLASFADFLFDNFSSHVRGPLTHLSTIMLNP